MYFCTFLVQNKVQCIYVLQALAPKPSKRWIAVEEIHEANVDPTRVYLKRLGRRSFYAVQLWSRSWIRRFLLKKMSTVFCRLSDYEPFRKPELRCNSGKPHQAVLSAFEINVFWGGKYQGGIFQVEVIVFVVVFFVLFCAVFRETGP